MLREQMAMGLGVAALSLLGLFQSSWLIARTRKGQWLVNRLGPERGLWGLRAALLLAAAFGVALATGWINPVRWPEDSAMSEEAARRLP